MDNTNKELRLADRTQRQKSKLQEITIPYTKGRWYCPICSLEYKQNEFIKESCDYCGEKLEKEW